jgi:hypothetical protein
MNLVIRTYPIGLEFFEDEIDRDIRQQPHLPNRGDKARHLYTRHLYTLQDREYVRKGPSPGGWVRIR